MSNSIIDSVLYGNGISFHIALDSNNAFYCETKPLAHQAMNVLSDLGFNPTMGRQISISSKKNGSVRVFPVYVKEIKGNALTIKVKEDLIRALGLEKFFKLPHLHHMGMKTLPLKNKGRRSGRRNHSARR